MLFPYWQTVNQNFSERVNSYSTKDPSSILYCLVDKPITKRLNTFADECSSIQGEKVSFKTHFGSNHHRLCFSFIIYIQRGFYSQFTSNLWWNKVLIRNYSYLFIRRSSDLSLAISSSYMYSTEKGIYLRRFKLFSELVWSCFTVINFCRGTS